LEAEVWYTSALIFMERKIKKTSGKITGISACVRSGRQRSNVYLDDKFAFSLDNEVIVKNRLQIGKQVGPNDVQSLSGEDQRQSCLNAAYRFLSYRPRSESEVRDRLKKHGYNESDIEATAVELRRVGLLDDSSFAEFWKQNRNSFKPRSQRMLKLELRQKGVNAEVIDETVSDIDDTENARKAALNKARTIPIDDYETFRSRLGGYLQRRGFAYRTINDIIKQAWQERNSPEG
jgi:regulatory protein